MKRNEEVTPPRGTIECWRFTAGIGFRVEDITALGLVGFDIERC